MVQTEDDVASVRAVAFSPLATKESIEACLALFVSHTFVTDADRKTALTKLKTHSRSTEGRDLIHASGVVPHLVQMIVDLGTIEAIMATIVNLAFSNHPHKRIIDALLDAGVLGRLVWAIDCQSELTVRSALNAMVNIGISGETNKDALSSIPDFAPQLVRCLKSPIEPVQLSAARLLHSICCRDNKVRILSSHFHEHSRTHTSKRHICTNPMRSASLPPPPFVRVTPLSKR